MKYHSILTLISIKKENNYGDEKDLIIAQLIAVIAVGLGHKLINAADVEIIWVLQAGLTL